MVLALWSWKKLVSLYASGLSVPKLVVEATWVSRHHEIDLIYVCALTFGRVSHQVAEHCVFVLQGTFSILFYSSSLAWANLLVVPNNFLLLCPFCFVIASPCCRFKVWLGSNQISMVKVMNSSFHGMLCCLRLHLSRTKLETPSCWCWRNKLPCGGRPVKGHMGENPSSWK